MENKLSELFNGWRSDPNISSNIVEWKISDERESVLSNFPNDIHPSLTETLINIYGITGLYSHQVYSYEQITTGNNIVISTGPASGKSLCYNIPIINSIINGTLINAIYVFPTKALAQDQLNNVQGLGLTQSAYVYDGDTPGHKRSEIRSKARILITNPDMLHIGILPHHTNWMEFLKNTKYIVLDEIHVYRGVFGSNFANLIRRIKRIIKFYGNIPQFIMTSATIGNPLEHAERLIGETVKLIDQDGSPIGKKHFILYNPPIVRKDLGLRKSAPAESIQLLSDLIHFNIQTIVFTRTRKAVELFLKSIKQEINGTDSLKIRGYRSGYLPGNRREIEQDLRMGNTRTVISTNALELGINIGSIDAVLMVGYPGTISSTRQQAGRAGRKHGQSLAVFVASSGLIDQYIVKHPEYLFDSNPEKALIDPNNLLILWKQIRCASFELPFTKGDTFGDIKPEVLIEILSIIETNGELHSNSDRYFWISDSYPANDISLRTTTSDTILLQVVNENKLETIGKVDRISASWMVHPNAIYIHDSKTYLVKYLDISGMKASLIPIETDYFTEPKEETSFIRIETLEEIIVNNGIKSYGEIIVKFQVIGYNRISFNSREILSSEIISMPEEQLRTFGFWITLDSQGIKDLKDTGSWNNDPNDYGANWIKQRDLTRSRDQNTCQVCGVREKTTHIHVHHISPFRTFSSYIQANKLENLITLCPRCHSRAEINVRIRSGMGGLCYLIHNLAPIFLMCDKNDLGANFDSNSTLAEGAPAVVIYDLIPGGIGLAKNIFNNWDMIVKEAYNLVNICDCIDGCPSCVGPSSENGAGCKQETLGILSLLIQSPGTVPEWKIS